MMAKKPEDVIAHVDLDKGNGMPLSRKVAREVGGLIRSGELQAGQKLPPTAQLAGLLGISRQVAQDALSELAERRLVRRKRGLGTMVLEPREQPTVGLLTYVDEELPLTANVGWVINHDFLQVVKRRGWDHRQYMARDREKPADRLPPDLVTDLLSGSIDLLVASLVSGGIVENVVPSADVPVKYINPNYVAAEPALDDAVRWLWRQDCDRLGLITTVMSDAEEIADFVRDQAASFQLGLPEKWLQTGFKSSIKVGRRLFHELFDDGETPDGLIVMDDMIAYGLMEEANEAGQRLDPTRVIVMVNKGSSLYIPAACPRIEFDWSALIECGLNEWTESENIPTPSTTADRPVYGFVPNGREEEHAMEVVTASSRTESGTRKPASLG